MDADALTARLETLLEEERMAIRSIDGEAVERLAAEKLSIVESFKGAPAHEIEKLRRLSGELRRNAMLLLHGRDTLKGVVEAMRETTGARRSWTI